MSDFERNLTDIKNVIFDLDGTVWRWNELKPGAKDTIQELKAKGKNIFYVTNNSLLTRKELAKKLTNMGLDTGTDEIVSSGFAAAQYFQSNDIKRVYCIGEQGLIDELDNQHIKNSEEARTVVVGLDRNATYWKIAKAAERVADGASLYTLGLGYQFQAGDRTLPGNRVLWEAVKQTADISEATHLGKPSDTMISAAKEAFPLVPERTLVVGDSIHSDVMFGNKMGVKTGLVLGGQTDKEDLEDVSGLEVPNFVFESIERLLVKM